MTIQPQQLMQAIEAFIDSKIKSEERGEREALLELLQTIDQQLQSLSTLQTK